MRSEQLSARSLRDAIDTYRTEHESKLDEEALELLSKLAKSTDASEAFRRLGAMDRRAEGDLLAACIEADYLARNFPRLLQEQKDALSRSKRWHKALADLRSFVDEIAEENEPLRLRVANLDLWSLSVLERPADNGALKHALDLIERAMEWRRGIVQANLAHLGATRKSHIKEAAENAAIWVLAAGVYDAARTPPLPFERGGKAVADVNLAEIADFAQVILGTEIHLDRVREVRRQRRKQYLEMFRDQTKRHIDGKVLQARSRDPS